MPMPGLHIGRIGIGSNESKQAWPTEVINRVTEDDEQRITEDGEERIK